MLLFNDSLFLTLFSSSLRVSWIHLLIKFSFSCVSSLSLALFSSSLRLSWIHLVTEVCFLYDDSLRFASLYLVTNSYIAFWWFSYCFLHLFALLGYNQTMGDLQGCCCVKGRQEGSRSTSPPPVQNQPRRSTLKLRNDSFTLCFPFPLPPCSL